MRPGKCPACEYAEGWLPGVRARMAPQRVWDDNRPVKAGSYSVGRV